MRFLYYYFQYLIKSSNLHGIHSPFVYDLVKDVIYAKKQKHPLFKSIEQLRKKIYHDPQALSGTDHGAGSSKPLQPSIGEFARNSSKSAKYCKLLYRLALWKKPNYALEFGTALGLSAMYQSCGFDEKTKFITLEGNPVLAQKAQSHFNSLKLKNIESIVGPFAETLPLAIKKYPKFDWVFFDGNHQCEATLNYFETCLNHSTEKAIFIFDDINWSTDMRLAWQAIQQHPRVFVTIDLFFMGLVFIEPRPEKEHFVVRF